MEQSTEEKPEFLEFFSQDYSPKSLKLCSQLDISHEWISRWETLSIGERKKLQIASALSLNTNVLIVDEPSNHLDLRSKKIIYEALKTFTGIGILVSHDRLLLNKLCHSTLFLEGSKLKAFRLPYDLALEQCKVINKTKDLEKRKLKKEASRIKLSAQLQKEKIKKRKSSLSKRKLSIKDSDAREKINRAKLFGADLSDNRKLNALQQRNLKLQKEASSIILQKDSSLGVFFQVSPDIKNIYLSPGKVSTNYIHLEYPELYFNSGDKLAVIGNNGVGKSTLLRHWLKILKQPFTFAPQEFSCMQMESLSKSLLEYKTEIKAKIFTLISCFGADPKQILAGSIPSPGVWQKIMIAKAIIDRTPVLVLDEPNNHLDLKSLAILESALKKYQGIIICVSHDMNFLENFCNLKLEIKEDKPNSRDKSCLFSSYS